MEFSTASSYNLVDLKRTKQAARAAMDANDLQQKKLREYIQKLQSSLANMDTMIDEAEKFTGMEQDLDDDDGDDDGNEDKEADRNEIKCIQVDGAIRTQHMTRFWTDENSPFYEDATQRERYISFTRPRPWKASEKKSLKMIVIAEQKRLYALELKASGHTDSLNAVLLNEDVFYESRDTYMLDWEKISKKVSTRSAKSTAPRSPVECKVQWRGLDHPQIKKGAWTSPEMEELVAAVKDLRVATAAHEDERNDEDGHNDRPDVRVDWSQGSRTASQCLSRWLQACVACPQQPEADDDDEASANEHAERDSDKHSRSPPPNRTQRKSKRGGLAAGLATATTKMDGAKRFTWTKEEDNALLEAVKIHGTGSWNTSPQCQNRYTRSLGPSIRRGAWTEEEDELLTRSVQEVESSLASLGNANAVNNKKWKKVAALVPGRTNSQCRERWVNYLDPSISKDDWTAEEDKMLVSLKESGSKWVEVAAALDGRTDYQCMTRYKHIMDNKPSSRKTKWTKEEDVELVAYKKRYPKASWKEVAESVGSKTSIQCFSRWKHAHKGKGQKKGSGDVEFESENSGDEGEEGVDDTSGASDSSYGAYRKGKAKVQDKGTRRRGKRSKSNTELDTGSEVFEPKGEEREVGPKLSPRHIPKPRPRRKSVINTSGADTEFGGGATRKRKRDVVDYDEKPSEAGPSQEPHVEEETHPRPQVIGVRISLRKRAKVDYALPVVEDDSEARPSQLPPSSAPEVNAERLPEDARMKRKTHTVKGRKPQTKVPSVKTGRSVSHLQPTTSKARRSGRIASPSKVAGGVVAMAGQKTRLTIADAGGDPEESDLTELSDE
ncbi:hypothetical protein FRB97_000582 [Tulasnella sp. 331]|nr:hypothetical protein FRB97_000582 [Tulasnella sp. 331]